jgi:hypothetical protein
MKRTFSLFFLPLLAIGCHGGNATSIHEINGVTITVRHAGSDKETMAKRTGLDAAGAMAP